MSRLGKRRTDHLVAGALTLIAACCVGSCSKTVGPSQGGLMLLVSTEGTLPVGRLDVSVTSGGTTLLSQSYKVPEEAQLPTSIALVSNGNPSAEATISVTGWEVTAGQPDIPLDRRDEIVTQIPTDRVAELRVVLSARCTKWVDESGEPTCVPAGDTCDSATGACVAPDISAPGLASYVVGDETSADGGGGGAGAAGGVAGEGGSSGGGAESLCGNGVLDGTERCDDGNAESGDGCNAACKVEDGWECTQSEPSKCAPICGDGLVVGAEAKAGGCDDDNTAAGDGCSASCKVETGYVCSGAPSVCAMTCGNGKLDPGEACDDGNAKAGDGCFACAVESGYTCDTQQPSVCTDINECTAGTSNCSANATCSNSVGSFSCACNAGYSGNGVTCSLPSCVGLAANCGASSNDDCCAAPTVTGGTFTLGGVSGTTTATVATFALDKYEVTVGRFRKFVAANTGYPAANAGANSLIAGSGWQTAWNIQDPSLASAIELTTAVQCDSTYQTWNASGTNDRLPMNCVDWYEAFAFCAWDGGRLPTEAEWEYAAADGANELTYPWGNTPVPDNEQDSTAAYANYDGLGDGSVPGSLSFADILPVGSKPLGVGKFGQLDLAGSMWEWALDGYAFYPSTCNNCAHLAADSGRVVRGGGWFDNASFMTAAYRSHDVVPSNHYRNNGFRCARTP